MTKKPKTPPHDPETGELVDQAPYLRSLGLRPVLLDDYGRETLDPTPIAPPIGYKKEPSMVEIVRQQIRTEMSRQAVEEGKESFEEADDFDVDDDFDPSSPYEEMFDPAPPAPRFRTAQEEVDPARPHSQTRDDFKKNPDKFLKPKKAEKPAKPAAEVKGGEAAREALDDGKGE